MKTIENFSNYSVFSLTESDSRVKFQPGQKTWERIKKKMVPVQDPRVGKIRTESNVWIPATYKTGRYVDWNQETKIEEQVNKEFEDDENVAQPQKIANTLWGRHSAKQELKKRLSGNDRELKNPERIVPQRLRLEHIKKKEAMNKIKKAANRKKHMKQQKRRSKK